MASRLTREVGKDNATEATPRAPSLNGLDATDLGIRPSTPWAFVVALPVAAFVMRFARRSTA